MPGPFEARLLIQLSMLGFRHQLENADGRVPFDFVHETPAAIVFGQPRGPRLVRPGVPVCLCRVPYGIEKNLRRDSG